MKVCIFGAGAIGGYLASGLARVEGIDLALIDQGPHLDAIQDNGLKVIVAEEERVVRVRATGDPQSLGPQDVVLNCLKAHQAWAAADSFAPLLGRDTAVVTCQNGIPWWYFYKIGEPFEGRRLDSVDRGDRQWNAIGPERAVGCSIYPAAEIVEPGIVRSISGDKFGIGEPDGAETDRVKKIAEMLQAAGFKAPIIDDMRSDIWLKLWGNLCFNPISALTRATLDVVATDPGSRAVAKAMMLEGQQVGEALGARFRVDVEKRIKGAARVGAHRTSMLQDLLAGKAMEIDALVTVVQEMGRMVSVPTPTLDMVLSLVQQLGRSEGLYPTYPEDD